MTAPSIASPRKPETSAVAIAVASGRAWPSPISASLTAWYDLYEGLRDTPLWTVPYFETRQIVVAVEDGFDGYEARTARTGADTLRDPALDRGAA